MRSLASIQYTAVITQNNTQRGPYHCDFGIRGIVMRRNVLFDRWMTCWCIIGNPSEAG